MSSLVYPNNILGLSFNCVRTPVWNTLRFKAVSQKRSSIQQQLYPVIHFELDYELLRDDLTVSDLKQLVGLFNAMRGGYDTFLFSDPDFNTFPVSNAQQFGTGDSSTKSFQITATYQNPGGPGYPELIQNFNGAPTILSNGAVVSAANYSISGQGIITFNTAPNTGSVLTWYGSFYYRCEFDDDQLDLSKFVNQWWQAKTVKFTSIKL